MSSRSKSTITTDELRGRLSCERRLFAHDTPMQCEFHVWVRSAIRRLEEPHTPAEARQVFEEWLVHRAPFVRPLKERLLPWRWGKNLAPLPSGLRLVDTGGLYEEDLDAVERRLALSVVDSLQVAVAPGIEIAREAAQAAIDGDSRSGSTVSKRDRVLAMTDEERARAGVFIFDPSRYRAGRDADDEI
ncbi:hypothetical protein AXK56_16720 [Tsukamurella pulmonis]|uniref:Uncharacterized protein n=1 Tax=Tsukamurella pulmonis TaxID=47312 RepID=A0A1H1AC72_9ACTN|nr:hypothetical protein [Tsukamurella pulmonis]KXO95853.1 hypothetical protein AXK56_16720 [Tsukamurella pulmonis]SDQ37224.1 hypothetical protein SAMN04489765_0153 [Tsukamurella pulmonis]SUQ39383.1 Uncharacterised protein [Tsukamurella pulmonis]